VSTHADSTGAPVTIELADRAHGIRSYAIGFDERADVGGADFIEAADGARIFFHTEVDAEFGGRGLAGLLVREALADSIRTGTVVVAVCPLFVRHLRQHGDEFAADGGRSRRATPDDLALVRRAVRGG
jgi:uncharacterized protein